MFVDKTVAGMLDEIHCSGMDYFEILIPEEKRERYFVKTEQGKSWLQIFPEYVEGILSTLSPDSGVQPDYSLQGAVSLALENSLTRGHGMDMKLPISVKLLSGAEGCIIRIRDSGEGFLYQNYVQRLRQGDRSYMQGSGLGLLILDSPQFEVAYEGRGNVINIMARAGYCLERTEEIFKRRKYLRGELKRGSS